MLSQGILFFYYIIAAQSRLLPKRTRYNYLQYLLQP